MFLRALRSLTIFCRFSILLRSIWSEFDLSLAAMMMQKVQRRKRRKEVKDDIGDRRRKSIKEQMNAGMGERNLLTGEEIQSHPALQYT
jgi:heme exporter protein D